MYQYGQKAQPSFEFGNDIMSSNMIDISSQYKFGSNYIHESPNDLNGRVQNLDCYKIEGIQFNNRVLFIKYNFHIWY